MRVRATKRQRNECPEEVRAFIPGDGARVTIGKEYEVHCISVFNGFVDLQIVDDLGYPSWCPLVLFELTHGKLPADWQSSSTLDSDSRGGASMAIGPEFVVKDEASIQAMMELDADQIDRFWKRVDSLQAANAALQD